MLLENIRQQEANKRVGSGFTLLRHKEDYQLYSFGCFDGKYLALKNKEDLV